MMNLLRPPLGRYEPLTSYTSRLAAFNGAEDMAQFLAHMGISESWIKNGRSNGIALVAELARLASEDIERHSIVRNGQEFRLNGQMLSRSSLRRTHLRVCLECLKEDMATNPGPPEARVCCRSTWLVASVYCCPEHSRRLYELPECPKDLSIYDFSRRLEPLLSQLDELVASQEHLSPTDYEQYAIRRVCGLKQAPTWLDAFPFYAFERMALNVGMVAVHGSGVEYELLSEDEIRSAMDRGFLALQKGQDGVEKVLMELREQFLQAKFDWGPRDVYGRLYEWLAHDNVDAVYDPLRKIMFDFTQANFPVGPSHEMFSKPFPIRILHSIRSASVETGLHPKRLRKLLLNAGLYPEKDRHLSDERVLFSANAAKHLLVGLTDSLKFNQIGPYLNIPRAQMLALQNADIFEPDVSFEATSGRVRAYSRQKLDAFMEALHAGAASIPEVSDGLMPIPAAAKRACCSAGEIVRLILGGRLMRRSILAGERGYMALLVDPEEVKPLIRGEDHGGVSLQKAEKQLGVSPPVLAALIDHGYLPSREAINPVNRCPQRVVDQMDIDAFRLRYVGLTELGAKLGEYLGDLKERLDEAGIKPKIPADLVNATFYLRSDVHVR
ncbi:MAG: hypothetical protein E6Q98_15000 [Rhodospirillaceae bacterium]|nr:MAG: hypothetical protein E6Q98_15000 [Rhodospirillaceae bacterium]